MQSSSYELRTPIADKLIWIYTKKFLRLHWNDDRSVLTWRKNHPSFDSREKHLTYLSPQKSCASTKQSVGGWQYMYISRRCPWCNGYRRWKWTRWHEFKSWTRLNVFHIELIPLGKVWIQLFSLQLWVNSRAD